MKDKKNFSNQKPECLAKILFDPEWFLIMRISREEAEDLMSRWMSDKSGTFRVSGTTQENISQTIILNFQHVRGIIFQYGKEQENG